MRCNEFKGHDMYQMMNMKIKPSEMQSKMETTSKDMHGMESKGKELRERGENNMK